MWIPLDAEELLPTLKDVRFGIDSAQGCPWFKRQRSEMLDHGSWGFDISSLLHFLNVHWFSLWG